MSVLTLFIPNSIPNAAPTSGLTYIMFGLVEVYLAEAQAVTIRVVTVHKLSTC